MQSISRTKSLRFSETVRVKQVSFQSPKRKNTRRVTFSSVDSSKEIESITSMGEEATSGVFFTPSELQKFQDKAAKVSQDVFEKDQDKMEGKCYSFDLWEAYRSCRNGGIPSDKVFDRLSYWIRKKGSRRGLERWSVPALEVSLAESQTRAVSCVLRMQEQNEDAETIARVYEELSHCEVMFALLVAKADEVAARDGNEDKQRKAEKRSMAENSPMSVRPRLQKSKSVRFPTGRERPLLQKSNSARMCTAKLCDTVEQVVLAVSLQTTQELLVQ